MAGADVGFGQIVKIVSRSHVEQIPMWDLAWGSSSEAIGCRLKDMFVLTPAAVGNQLVSGSEQSDHFLDLFARKFVLNIARFVVDDAPVKPRGRGVNQLTMSGGGAPGGV